jgi:hypothetical protein
VRDRNGGIAEIDRWCNRPACRLIGFGETLRGLARARIAGRIDREDRRSPDGDQVVPDERRDARCASRLRGDRLMIGASVLLLHRGSFNGTVTIRSN